MSALVLFTVNVGTKFSALTQAWLYVWFIPGNEAKDDGDLGTKVETDKCCRAHDHCKQYIPAHGSIGGTRNDSPYTISHCDCDSEFYHCLKKANSETAKKVGNIFFNVLQVPCFISQKGKSCRKEKCKDERKAVLQSPKKFWCARKTRIVVPARSRFAQRRPCEREMVTAGIYAGVLVENISFS